MAGTSKRNQSSGRNWSEIRERITKSRNTQLYYKNGKFMTATKKKTAGGKGG